MTYSLGVLPEESLRKTFRRCASDNFSLAMKYRDEFIATTEKEVRIDLDWHFGEQSIRALLFALPSKFSDYLPADPAFDQWPYNFCHFVMPWSLYDSNRHRTMSLVPYIKAELELALFDHQIPVRSDPRRKTAEVAFVEEVGRLSYRLIDEFVAVEEQNIFRLEQECWLTYFLDVSGCIDSDGMLNELLACSHALERAWGESR